MTYTQTLIFAHRGASGDAPENLRSAFELALQYGVDGIETDVQLSRDGVAVLWHDEMLDRIGLPGKRIGDFDYAELRTMDFAGRLAPGAAAEGIVGLHDFVAACAPRSKLLLEIKGQPGEAREWRERKVSQTCAALVSQPAGKLVSSFDLAIVDAVHSRYPQLPVIANFEPGEGITAVQRELAVHPFLHGICLEISDLDEKVVELLHENSKTVVVYTCNSAQQISDALRLGVDILISDWPQLALQMRQGLMHPGGN